MNRMGLWLSKIVLSGIIYCAGAPAALAQDSTAMSMESAMAALQALPPEQLQALLNMAISKLPPEKKANIEASLQTMKSEIPEVKSVQLKNKEISFIPISHASTPEFYNKVKGIVTDYKSKGYVVYYEQVNSKKHTVKDNGVDTLTLKFRKIIGLEPNRQTYALLKRFFPNVVSQPEYKDLGVTKTDVNADITLKQLVDRYEELYGTVLLTACDFDTKPGVLYSCGKLNNELSPVVLDYRNKFVADQIRSSRDKKILVIYGAQHIPGMIALLKEQ